MKAYVIAAAFAIAATLHAQDLAPELAPLVAKYDADTAALNTQKGEAISRLAVGYVAALDAAEKVETDAGRVAAVAAITDERNDVNKGGVRTDFPKDLPKSLHAAHKTYLDGVAHLATDFGQRRDRLTADALRALASLQTRAGGNMALARQIAAEKEKLLNGSRMDVVGLWELHNLGNNNIMLYELKADGTFADGSGKRLGTWEMKGKQVVSSWETQSGLSDSFDLPEKGGKLTGKNTKGTALVLTRKSQ